MSYTSLLISTCTVRRFTAGAQDAYGNPAETWADHLTSQACRLQSVTNTEIKVGAELVRADYKLFLQDIDITEQDRVVLGSITYEVLSVANRQDGTADHHKECLLRVLRGNIVP